VAINDKVRIKRAFANPASLGSNTLISALTGQKIKVLGMAIVAASANTISILSNTTDLSADMALAANGGLVLPFSKEGWFETASGEALNIDLSSAAQVGVTILYEVN
jgi:hypothetical protein